MNQSGSYVKQILFFNARICAAHALNVTQRKKKRSYMRNIFYYALFIGMYTPHVQLYIVEKRLKIDNSDKFI